MYMPERQLLLIRDMTSLGVYILRCFMCSCCGTLKLTSDCYLPECAPGRSCADFLAVGNAI